MLHTDVDTLTCTWFPVLISFNIRSVKTLTDSKHIALTSCHILAVNLIQWLTSRIITPWRTVNWCDLGLLHYTTVTKHVLLILKVWLQKQLSLMHAKNASLVWFALNIGFAFPCLCKWHMEYISIHLYCAIRNANTVCFYGLFYFFLTKLFNRLSSPKLKIISKHIPVVWYTFTYLYCTVCLRSLKEKKTVLVTYLIFVYF